jgi:transcriptional regulator with XRE-family HTH domain
MLRTARQRAGMTQRQLAQRLRVPQSQIARIESGAVVPRVDTLDRLLRGCGESLEAMPLLGIGVDRTGFREMLRLSPSERLERAEADASALDDLLSSVRR